MKKAFVRIGMCLLIAGFLAACNGSDDIVNAIEEPQQEQKEDPKDSDNERTDKDSDVVYMLPKAKPMSPQS